VRGGGGFHTAKILPAKRRAFYWKKTSVYIKIKSFSEMELEEPSAQFALSFGIKH